MYVSITIENRFISLCSVETEFNKKGKSKLKNAWKHVEDFLNKSNYAGVNNLLVTLEIDGRMMFDKTKVRLKRDHYETVFHMLEEFLLDKIYFFRQLEKQEIDDFLEEQYKQNCKDLKVIRNLKKEMRYYG